MRHYYEPFNHYPAPPTLGEYKGKLALFWGWEIDCDQPRYFRDIDISPISIERPLVRDYIGTVIRDWNGKLGILPKPMYGAGWIDTSEWVREREYKSIPKPRVRRRDVGKPYDWVWTPNFQGMWEGRWVRTYL